MVTGGGGFVGSHVVERMAKEGCEVLAIDSFSRSVVLGDHYLGREILRSNWERIKSIPAVSTLEADVRDAPTIERAVHDADIVVHTAGQVAVTTSLRDPRTDFDINVVGTLNVLEAARKAGSNPTIVFCSTNKVYGNHVNEIPVRIRGSRYEFDDPAFTHGVPESMQVDNCHHSPYGVSKLAADLYVQEYSRSYALPTAVFRMSCIYGTRQFGMEDQGWVAHFVLSALADRPLTIYGDGKQVRDVLFVDDLVTAFEAYIARAKGLGGRVFNIGGGRTNTLSLIELTTKLETLLEKRLRVSYAEWRPADQKVYISDIRKVRDELDWAPRVTPADGVARLIKWARDAPTFKAN